MTEKRTCCDCKDCNFNDQNGHCSLPVAPMIDANGKCDSLWLRTITSEEMPGVNPMCYHYRPAEEAD